MHFTRFLRKSLSYLCHGYWAWQHEHVPENSFGAVRRRQGAIILCDRYIHAFALEQKVGQTNVGALDFSISTPHGAQATNNGNKTRVVTTIINLKELSWIFFKQCYNFYSVHILTDSVFT